MGGHQIRESVCADLQVIGEFLARRDVPSVDPRELRRTFDVLVLCGSAVLASLDVAARAFHDGLVSGVLITGGFGHSTPYLYDAVRRHPGYADIGTVARPEAAVFADILRRTFAVPASVIVTEDHATNCGQNAELSLRILAGWTPRRPTVLLVQDPTMQRRTHASFERHQRDEAVQLPVVSYAPFLPIVTPDGVRAQPADHHPVWTLDRFASLALGEIRRLRDDEHGYGPRGTGFIDHVEIPSRVLAAYARVRDSAPIAARER